MTYLTSAQLPASVLHRLVQSGSSYPARPATGAVEFLGYADPGSLLLAGDTWTQLPIPFPLTPTIGTATGGNASATVAFTPANTGAAATSFTATSTPSSITATGSGSPITVAGLTNGTSYTFTVHASNSAGNSGESGASNSVTPAVPTPPGVPTIGTAVAGDSDAAVVFTPAGTGTPATSFTATSTPGGFTTTGAASPLVVTGLTNGTSYTFTVHATNNQGTSAESSASNSVTPVASIITDTFTGSDGSAWSSTVWKTAPSGITMDIQSNQGRASFTSTGSFEEFMRRLQPANSANWDIRFQLVTPPTTAGWNINIWFQATDWPVVNTPVSAYQFNIQSFGYFVASRLNNVPTGLANNLFNFSAGGWARVQIVNGIIGVKVWAGTAGNEPTSFTNIPNGTPLVGAGEAGFVFTAGNTAGLMDFRIDNVSVDNNPV